MIFSGSAGERGQLMSPALAVTLGTVGEKVSISVVSQSVSRSGLHVLVPRRIPLFLHFFAKRSS